MYQPAIAQEHIAYDTRVVLESDGWRLIGDLRLPESEDPVPAALLLNKAAGDRTIYGQLATHLAARGVASLRLDLPGHGESVNLGRFVPGEQARDPMIWGAEAHVIVAQEFLKSHVHIDGNRIGLVGGSYSGEEMAEAGREHGYGRAYVLLSPGSFSETSIRAIDTSGVPWLFVTSKDERFLREITASVQQQSETVELVIVPGTAHATDILAEVPDMAERIAVWLERRLR
jgi:dienelactone hydrolase